MFDKFFIFIGAFFGFILRFPMELVRHSLPIHFEWIFLLFSTFLCFAFYGQLNRIKSLSNWNRILTQFGFIGTLNFNILSEMNYPFFNNLLLNFSAKILFVIFLWVTRYYLQHLFIIVKNRKVRPN